MRGQKASSHAIAHVSMHFLVSFFFAQTDNKRATMSPPLLQQKKDVGKASAAKPVNGGKKR